MGAIAQYTIGSLLILLLQKLYEEEKVMFLCDKEDTVGAYEARAEQRQYTHDAGLEALSSGLNRVQHVEMVHGENHPLPLVAITGSSLQGSTT